MAIICEKFNIFTKGFNDVIDITSKVQNIISTHDIKNAIINLTINSSTASIITIEYEKGLIDDINKLLEDICPINKVYSHDLLWHEGNASSHLKGILLGNSLTLNIADSKLAFSDIQKIILIDFDTKPRTREITAVITY